MTQEKIDKLLKNSLVYPEIDEILGKNLPRDNITSLHERIDRWGLRLLLEIKGNTDDKN